MDELIAFLRKEIDLDEHRARAAIGKARHIVRHDLARVLREVEAKRKIVERVEVHAKKLARLNEQNVTGNMTERQQWTRAELGTRLNEASKTLCLLALSYVDRPGYREEWRP